MVNKIKAIIVDDEVKGREVLKSLLQNLFSEIELVGEAENVENAFELVNKVKPELVFLDIQMPRVSGFSLLKKFEEIPFEVIFVTSYDEYAINAIKFNALDYLLKPVEVKELKEAVNKAKKTIGAKQRSNAQMVNLLLSLNTKPSDKKVAVHVGEKVEMLNATDIAYIEADGSYCTIFAKDKEKYTTAKFLKDFEDYFGEESDFVRIHKSCLINVAYIKNYSKGEPCFIEMTDGNTFEVARRKKQEVLEKLKPR